MTARITALEGETATAGSTAAHVVTSLASPTVDLQGFLTDQHTISRKELKSVSKLLRSTTAQRADGDQRKKLSADIAAVGAVQEVVKTELEGVSPSSGGAAPKIDEDSASRRYLFVAFSGRLGNTMFQYASALGIAARAPKSRPMSVCFLDTVRQWCPDRGQIDSYFPPPLWHTGGDHSPMSLEARFNGSRAAPDAIFPHLTQHVGASPCSRAALEAASHDCKTAGDMYVNCPGETENAHLTVAPGECDAENFCEGLVKPILDSETSVRLGFYTFMQSSLYFKQIEPQIRREFTFSKQLQQASDAVLDRATGQRLVGIHLRFGDLAGKGCGEAYYENAMNYFRAKHGVTVKFVVVTIDPDAAHKMACMHRSDTSILPKGRSAALDMCILTRADDVITSVGTFSWWGGYLSGGAVLFCDALYQNKDFWVDNWVGISSGKPDHK
jgi:hypothetical protein